STSATLQVTVTNVPPVLAALATGSSCCSGAVPGQPLFVSPNFTDVGTQDTHTATINWGDGTPVASATITEAGGSGSLAASHIYASAGIYTVNTTLRDDDGGTDVKTSSVYVTGAAVSNGTLYVIGTNHDDHVTINETGNGYYKVHADFLPGGA